MKNQVYYVRREMQAVRFNMLSRQAKVKKRLANSQNKLKSKDFSTFCCLHLQSKCMLYRRSTVFFHNSFDIFNKFSVLQIASVIKNYQLKNNFSFSTPTYSWNSKNSVYFRIALFLSPLIIIIIFKIMFQGLSRKMYFLNCGRHRWCDGNVYQVSTFNNRFYVVFP